MNAAEIANLASMLNAILTESSDTFPVNDDRNMRRLNDVVGSKGKHCSQWGNVSRACPYSPSRHRFLVKKVKVKFSHTRHRALGPELIPVYRQSARR